MSGLKSCRTTLQCDISGLTRCASFDPDFSAFCHCVHSTRERDEWLQSENLILWERRQGGGREGPHSGAPSIKSRKNEEGAKKDYIVHACLFWRCPRQFGTFVIMEVDWNLSGYNFCRGETDHLNLFPRRADWRRDPPSSTSLCRWMVSRWICAWFYWGEEEERRGTKPSDKTHSGRTHFLTIALPPLSFGLV